MLLKRWIKNWVLLLTLVLFNISCARNSASEICRRWIGKQISFPQHVVFTKFAKDTVESPDLYGYKVLLYVDSLGCFSCKTHLPVWNVWLDELDSLTQNKVSMIMVISTSHIRQVERSLKYIQYSRPIVIDEADEFNRLNHFPEDDAFRTFLLDSANRVVAIGNPIHNPKVAKLYHKILGVSASSSQPESNSMSLGSFPWQKPQTVMFKVPNRDAEPLTLDSITTSCECTTASCAKNEALPGDTLFVSVTYTAEQAGEFMREVYLHLANSAEPKVLTITGNAQ